MTISICATVLQIVLAQSDPLLVLPVEYEPCGGNYTTADNVERALVAALANYPGRKILPDQVSIVDRENEFVSHLARYHYEVQKVLVSELDGASNQGYVTLRLLEVPRSEQPSRILARLRFRLPPTFGALEDETRRAVNDLLRQAAIAEATKSLPADAARAAGQLWVRTLPTGAGVLVDRVARGKAPLKIEGLSPGPHELALDLEDFFPRAEPVTVMAGRVVEMNYRLTPNEAARDQR